MKGDTVLSCFSNHHCMNEIEYFLLFLRGREAQLVSVGLKETGDVQVSEAVRQVYNFETFPNFISHKSVIWEQIPVLSSWSMDE